DALNMPRPGDAQTGAPADALTGPQGEPLIKAPGTTKQAEELLDYGVVAKVHYVYRGANYAYFNGYYPCWGDSAAINNAGWETMTPGHVTLAGGYYHAYDGKVRLNWQSVGPNQLIEFACYGGWLIEILYDCPYGLWWANVGPGYADACL